MVQTQMDLRGSAGGSVLDTVLLDQEEWAQAGTVVSVRVARVGTAVWA